MKAHYEKAEHNKTKYRYLPGEQWFSARICDINDWFYFS